MIKKMQLQKKYVKTHSITHSEDLSTSLKRHRDWNCTVSTIQRVLWLQIHGVSGYGSCSNITPMHMLILMFKTVWVLCVGRFNLWFKAFGVIIISIWLRNNNNWFKDGEHTHARWTRSRVRSMISLYCCCDWSVKGLWIFGIFMVAAIINSI